MFLSINFLPLFSSIKNPPPPPPTPPPSKATYMVATRDRENTNIPRHISSSRMAAFAQDEGKVSRQSEKKLLLKCSTREETKCDENSNRNEATCHQPFALKLLITVYFLSIIHILMNIERYLHSVAHQSVSL